MKLKTVYLVLAIIGAVVPYVFFAQHFESVGFSLMSFITALYANPAASGFTSDLLISSFIFWIAMFQQRNLGKGPKPTAFIILNLLIGLSCALPAYLYARMTSDDELDELSGL